MLRELVDHPQQTLVTVILDHDDHEWKQVEVYGQSPRILIGDWNLIQPQLTAYGITRYHVFTDHSHSLWPLVDYHQMNCRIEPGALIRQGVQLEEGVVIMMGAVINIGAVIHEKTMIDMNAVVGSGAIIGRRCHLSAGAVISGVLEPAGDCPVVIEDDVFIGANAVILEGVRVHRGAVIAAGAVVRDDVEENTMVAGVPAKMMGKVKDKTRKKTEIEEKLRQKLI